MKVLWGLLGFFVLAGGIALTVLLAVETHAALLGVPVIIVGILLLIASRWMPKRTAKGYAVLRHTLGFKRFIDESEKHRAQFAERANIFSEYLPYAVVFGATEKWAKAFEGLGEESRHVVVVRVAARVQLRWCSRAPSTASPPPARARSRRRPRRAARAGSAAAASPAAVAVAAAADPGSARYESASGGSSGASSAPIFWNRTLAGFDGRLGSGSV